MSRWAALFIALVLGAGCLVYLRSRSRPETPALAGTGNALGEPPSSGRLDSGATGSVPNQTPPKETGIAADATAAAPRPAPASPAPAVEVPETSESSSLPPGTVLDNLRVTLRQYGSALGENPVGTNPEITAALHGDNPKHINFLREDGNRVNASGELVDVWGTPYFFHQMSAHEMEIRSAGPDRVFYTADDLVTK